MALWIYFVIVLLTLSMAIGPTRAQQNNRSPRAFINNGLTEVQGFQHRIQDGRMANIFLGIPFGIPPVGALRYHVQEEINTFLPTKLATIEFKDRCMQAVNPPRPPPLPGLEVPLPPGVSEDCLYLNVMAPSWRSTNTSGLFPVFVWVHGGGFEVGSAVMYGYEGISNILVAKDVIVVTINYRLGAFGFMYLGDDTLRANIGLWDQTLALRWVNQNIRGFGGDPDRVTIVGESAGSASVLSLALSPHSRDFFQNIIAMSGALTAAPWLIDPSGTNVKKQTTQLVNMLAQEQNVQVPRTDGDKLTFLKTLNAETILSTLERVKETATYGAPLFIPVLDDVFIPKRNSAGPNDRKNIIHGTMELEGTFLVRAYGIKGKQQGDTTVTEEDFDAILSGEPFFTNITGMGPNLAGTEAKQYYLRGVDNNNNTAMLERYAQLLGDVAFVRPTLCDVRAMLNLSWNVWLYSVEYANPNAFPPSDPIKRPTHGFELPYLFNRSLLSVPVYWNQNDVAMMDVLSTLWTNFVKYSNPTPRSMGMSSNIMSVDWRPLTRGNPYQYLSIKPIPEVKEGYHMEAINVIDNIYNNP